MSVAFMSLQTFSQVAELEEFKRAITLSVFYETGRIDTIVKSETKGVELRKHAYDAFMKFVMHQQSHNLDNLKSLANHSGSTYWFDVYSYTFYSTNYYFDLYRNNPDIQNPVHQIIFSGLYDYETSNFISLYIQEFTIREKGYAVYYCSSLEYGMYYIKDVAENVIVFESNLVTSGTPIYKIDVLDKQHLLVIEDMDTEGQRAVVLNTNSKMWKTIDAFKGKGFTKNSSDYTSKVFFDKRTYLRLASLETLSNMYGMGWQAKNRIALDKNSLTISYKQGLSGGGNNDTPIQAKWSKYLFVIDDYFFGEHIDYSSRPVPD